MTHDMYALPRALERYQGLSIVGQVAYPDHVVDIPTDAVEGRLVENLGGLMRRLASEIPARRVPPASAGSARSPRQTALNELRKGLHEEGMTDDF